MSVIYVDGSYGTIHDQDLDELLGSRQIRSFLRSSGWATVGKDELRSNRNNKKGSWRDRKISRMQISNLPLLTM